MPLLGIPSLFSPPLPLFNHISQSANSTEDQLPISDMSADELNAPGTTQLDGLPKYGNHDRQTVLGDCQYPIIAIDEGSTPVSFDENVDVYENPNNSGIDHIVHELSHDLPPEIDMQLENYYDSKSRDLPSQLGSSPSSSPAAANGIGDNLGSSSGGIHARQEDRNSLVCGLLL